MTERAYLVLEDGTVFSGKPFGAEVETHGEVVFTTSMAGYQEALTDPSYAGQILTMTFPLQGNYGVNEFDTESRRVQVRGFVVREACDVPSHWRGQGTLHEYLASAGVPGIEGIDTRALTRRLRTAGVMMGAITREESAERALNRLRDLPRYEGSDFVQEVSAAKPFAWDHDAGRLASRLGLQSPYSGKAFNNLGEVKSSADWASAEGGLRIMVFDLGVKHNILRILSGLGCRTIAVPCSTTADDILALQPDGIVMSPGPGDPALLDYATETARGLLGRVPIFGICLGLQVLAHAWGARTFKLKFGHRGANHPVREETTGRVSITAQNHGYAVDPDGLPPDIEVSHINLNDGTCEGLRHRELPVFAIQYHSEASPGPHDDRYLFERFLALVEERSGR